MRCTHARTHRRVDTALTKPQNACRGGICHFSHEQPAHRSKLPSDATCGTSPCSGIMRTFCNSRGGHCDLARHMRKGSADSAPWRPSRGMSTIARTHACARPRSRSGTTIDRSVSTSKKRSGGKSVEVGETSPASENQGVGAPADEGKAYVGHDARLDGPQVLWDGCRGGLRQTRPSQRLSPEPRSWRDSILHGHQTAPS